MAKKKLLTLKSRPCKIGPSINTRTEKHGEEDVPACDIPLQGVMLDAGELNTLLGNDKAHEALFRIGEHDTPEPVFSNLKPLALKDRFEDCWVTIKLYEDIEIKLDARLANIKLEPQFGGLTGMNVHVQCTPPVDDMAQLIAFLNAEVEARIVFGRVQVKEADKQAELPMPVPGATSDGEQPPATH